MSDNTTIRVENLVTGYHTKHGDTVITRDINASLRSGELTCLLGPNGAGKSTLLRTLAAFQPPLSGDIYLAERNLKSYTDAQLAKVIGVVLTERIHLSNMTIEELIGMGRSPYTGFWGKLSPQDRQIVDEAISTVGIENLHGRMIQTLSDGERQKVMIAKALVQETPVIFLDEPTAFLDYPSKVEIMQLLQHLSRRQHKTIFLSTHDLELALQIADRIWLIDKGKELKIGTPEDLSLSGDMSHFFEREGIRFDLDLGLFRIDNVRRYPVKVIGEGRRYNMVQKALARNGYFIDNHLETTYVIEITPTRYLVNRQPVETIAELLEILHNQPLNPIA